MARRIGIARAPVTAVAALVATLASPASAESAVADPLGSTERVPVGLAGSEPDGESYAPSVSANGRYVAFESAADNLVPGDTNEVADVFVRDLRSGTTERVSVGTDGAQADRMSWGPQVSADGRTVLFESQATTFDGPAAAGDSLTFVRELDAGTTRRVRVDQDAAPVWMPALSGNGRFVAFMTTAALVRRDRSEDDQDIYRVDLASGKLRLVSVNRFPGKEPQLNERPTISRDGRVVAWTSSARLVRRDHNHTRDIYVRDLGERHPRRVSESSRGTEADKGSMGASVSASGRYVAFSSLASTLVRRDRNEEWDVFVHDRREGTTRRVSIPQGGGQSNGQSQAYAAWGEHAGISRDGRYVVFTSRATNLVAGDENGALDVFVRDRTERQTWLVSATPEGAPGAGVSSAGAVSSNGSTLVFGSAADDLVTGDLNGVTDVFVRRIG